jgi:hypothetical protein
MPSSRKTTLSITGFILFTFLTVTASGVSAHGQDKTETKIPCSEVLKVSLDKFVDEYAVKKGHTYQETYSIYEKCKQRDNDRRLRHLPTRARNQIVRLRKTLGKWKNAIYEMCWSDQGGGTLYAHMQQEDDARREVLLSEVIGRLEKPGSTGPQDASHAKSSVDAFFRRVRRAYPLVSREPDNHMEDHARAFLDLRRETPRLRSQVRALPPSTLKPLIGFMNRALAMLLREHKQ